MQKVGEMFIRRPISVQEMSLLVNIINENQSEMILLHGLKLNSTKWFLIQ